MGTLASTAPTPTNRAFLESLVEALELDVARPPRQIEGVTQEFVDGLDRVPRKTLKEDDTKEVGKRREVVVEKGTEEEEEEDDMDGLYA
ncbi:hypothetical protein N0V88_005255 [Collariella sp. IMI 366227]|nr:hypothetical protein N0V88_005255 [Collariella sp. IMI 366227]